MKVEFPVLDLTDLDACHAACAELDAAVDGPWVLLSAGVTFEGFRTQVDVAADHGCSGFMAGRAIWGDAVGRLSPAGPRVRSRPGRSPARRARRAAGGPRCRRVDAGPHGGGRDGGRRVLVPLVRRGRRTDVAGTPSARTAQGARADPGLCGRRSRSRQDHRGLPRRRTPPASASSTSTASRRPSSRPSPRRWVTWPTSTLPGSPPSVTPATPASPPSRRTTSGRDATSSPSRPSRRSRRMPRRGAPRERVGAPTRVVLCWLDVDPAESARRAAARGLPRDLAKRGSLDGRRWRGGSGSGQAASPEVDRPRSTSSSTGERTRRTSAAAILATLRRGTMPG